MQTPNTTTEASIDREPHDSIRKVNSTSKGTTGDNDIAQNNTGHHRRPQGITWDPQETREHTHVKRVN